MNLRPYQATAIEGLRAAFRAGKRAPVLVAPPGAGKTCMAAHCVAGHVVRAGVVSWYAHRRELCVQAAASLRALGLEVGLFGEGRSAPVQVTMLQGAVRRREIGKCTLAVLDECHHVSADTWADVPKALRESGTLLLGLTATPERGDGRGLAPIFDAVVVAAQVRELIALGSLVAPEIVAPARHVPAGQLAQHPLKAYQAHGGGRRAVLFAPNLRAAKDWLADFEGAGIAARMVSGAQPVDERDEAFAALRSGAAKVLINVAVATEGTDLPEVEVVILARPVGTTGLFLQMVGRGARPYPGKAHYTLIDLCGAVDSHGRPDDDREYSLDGVAISAGGGSATAMERLCRLCKLVLDGADICPRCQHDNGLVVPEDAGIELRKWDAKRAADDTPEKRARQLAAWMRRFPGRNAWFYKYRFKAVYGALPSLEVVALADAMTRRTA